MKVRKLRYALWLRWANLKHWLTWKFKRLIFRVVFVLIWKVSPRLRQEFKAAEQRAWNDGCAFVEFGEWLGRRVWPPA